jgi:hypothetical protein
MAVMTNGQIPVGQTGADPLPKTMSGDCTLAATGAITCTKVNNILPGQPALKVRLAASQSVTTGTKTKIAFDTVDLDTGSNWSSVNKQWNPLISGTYMVCAAMFPLGTSITNVQIFILKNTTDQIINTQASAASVPACTLITMNGTTDFIEADGIVTATSPQFLGASTGQTQMTAYRIGP